MIDSPPDNKLQAIDAVLASAGLERGFYCYGVDDAPDAPLLASQRRLADLLLEALDGASPDALAEQRERLVALCGPSCESLCAELRARVREDRERGGLASLTFVALNVLEEQESASFDAVFIEGSYRSIDQLALLSTVRGALRHDGAALILSEYLDDDGEVSRSPLANVSSLKQLSSRLGYRLESEVDLTAAARRSIDHFQSYAQAEAAAELARYAEVRSLLDELSHADREFASGRRCLRLFKLRAAQRAAEQADDEYVHAVYGDRASFSPEAIASLFEASFGQPFDAALWHWKYELGEGRCVAARAETNGELVAHYGGAPRHIRYFGREAIAIQPCDVMVMPENRTRYGRGSLFFKVAATFLEREIGNTVDHLLGFGFPNKKTMRLAIRLGLYEKTDDFVELRLPLLNEAKAAASSLAPFDPDSAQQREWLGDLWREMADEFTGGIVGERDWRYIAYRYLRHPHRDRYSMRWLLNGARAPEALVVLKRSGDAWLLMDLVCAPSVASARLAGLNEALAAESIDAGEPPRQLLFWITRGWLSALELDRASVHDLGIEIPCNSWNPGPPSALLYGKWWLTAGDMDFQ